MDRKEWWGKNKVRNGAHLEEEGPSKVSVSSVKYPTVTCIRNPASLVTVHLNHFASKVLSFLCPFPSLHSPLPQDSAILHPSLWLNKADVHSTLWQLVVSFLRIQILNIVQPSALSILFPLPSDNSSRTQKPLLPYLRHWLPNSGPPHFFFSWINCEFSQRS